MALKIFPCLGSLPVDDIVPLIKNGVNSILLHGIAWWLPLSSTYSTLLSITTSHELLLASKCGAWFHFFGMEWCHGPQLMGLTLKEHCYIYILSPYSFEKR